MVFPALGPVDWPTAPAANLHASTLFLLCSMRAGAGSVQKLQYYIAGS